MDNYYEQKYYKYKNKYLRYKNFNKTLDGSTIDHTVPKKEKCIKIMSAYSFTVNSLDEHNDIVLGKIEKFRKISTIKINQDLAVGDFDYEIIKNMKKGMYNIYLADDNLVAVHESRKPELTVEELKRIVFKYSGAGVGVDSGRFGFYDSEPLKYIVIGDKLPYLFFDDNKLKKYLADNFYVVTINDLLEATKDMREEDLVKNIPKKELLDKYTDNVGFIADTGTGDGGFDCYINNNDIAILIGGITQDILAADNNSSSK